MWFSFSKYDVLGYVTVVNYSLNFQFQNKGCNNPEQYLASMIAFV